MKRALFIGRFQPFHKGHIYCVKKLLKSFDEVIIVVGSAQESRTKKNPFTAGERVEMIRLSFKSELSRILILPVPDINNHPYWVSHILSYVPKFDEVYSNNELVLELFKEKGFSVKEIGLFKRKQYEGSKIRFLLNKSNHLWKKFVIKKVSTFIESLNLDCY